MELKRRPNLTRFKKSPQGAIEFATILEQAEPDQRDVILDQVKDEDPDFLAEVMRKVVYFDEMSYLDEATLAEVLGNASPKIVAYAVFGMPDDFKAVFVRLIGHSGHRAMVDEQEMMGAEPDQALVLGARKQLQKIARKLESQNKITFEVPNCPRNTKKRRKGRRRTNYGDAGGG